MRYFRKLYAGGGDGDTTRSLPLFYRQLGENMRVAMER